jgi:hypothetical protein
MLDLSSHTLINSRIQKSKKINVMKKMILYVACVLIVASVAAAPGSKLVERFNATFPNAKNVKWLDDKDGYFVSFTQDENFIKAFYNKGGEFVYSLKYLSNLELPVNIRMVLNKNFGDSKVLGVTEVTTPNNTAYDVKLVKGEKLYCLYVLADGTITKQDKYDYNGN